MLDVLACGYLSKQAERGTMPTSRLMMRGSAELISYWAKESTRVLSKRWRASNKEDNQPGEREPRWCSTQQRWLIWLWRGEGKEDRNFTIPMQICDLR
jgi:hypothetical protein